MSKELNAAALLRLIEYARGEAFLLGMPAVAGILRAAELELTRHAGTDIAQALIPAEGNIWKETEHASECAD